MVPPQPSATSRGVSEGSRQFAIGSQLSLLSELRLVLSAALYPGSDATEEGAATTDARFPRKYWFDGTPLGDL